MGALMLNPSIANETDLDPTLRRVKRFARDWGFGGMRIVNAFAIVSTDPAMLRGLDACSDLENDAHILDVVQECPRVMVGWGANLADRRIVYRREQLDKLLSRATGEVLAWRITASGHPQHPLYMPATIQPVPYRATA
jgi:hypothetical protein